MAEIRDIDRTSMSDGSAAGLEYEIHDILFPQAAAEGADLPPAQNESLFSDTARLEGRTLVQPA